MAYLDEYLKAEKKQQETDHSFLIRVKNGVVAAGLWILGFLACFFVVEAVVWILAFLI